MGRWRGCMHLRLVHVCAVIHKLLLDFWIAKKKDRHLPHLAEKWPTMDKNVQKERSVLFLSKKANTAVHIPLRPVTQRLSSRPRSTHPRQLWGHTETRLSLTASQSIVADYWLEKRAGVSAAALLLLRSRTQFHTQTTMNTRCTNATSCCSQTPFLSHQHTHEHTNTLYNVQMHNYTHCNVDNLSNEGWQVAAAGKLSTVGPCGLARRARRYDDYKWANAVFHLNFLFLQFGLAPSTRKANHYLFHTIYEHPKSRMEKSTLRLCVSVHSTIPLFSISMYGTAVWLRGDRRGSLFLCTSQAARL